MAHEHIFFKKTFAFLAHSQILLYLCSRIITNVQNETI
jgi:hypothetical protein